MSNRDAGWEFSAVQDIYAVRPSQGNVDRLSDGAGPGARRPGRQTEAASRAWAHAAWIATPRAPKCL